jgi:ATP-dependent helicase Lhr and Lhr-like helicase
VDWRRGTAQVEPAPDGGRARWIGDGRALSWDLCQGIRRVLADASLDGVTESTRAREKLAEARTGFAWLREAEETVIVRLQDGPLWWWTFAGMYANQWLAGSLPGLVDRTGVEDLRVRLVDGTNPDELAARLRDLAPETLSLGARVAEGAIDRLKFAEALPEEAAERVVVRRMRADAAVAKVLDRPLRVFSLS